MATKQWFFLNLSRMRLIQRLVQVRELFKPAEFGSRFPSGASAQSSSEGIKMNRIRIKLNIPIKWWLLINLMIWYLEGWYAGRSAPIKSLSDGSALKLVVWTCCELSPGWRFALFCGGELLESSICSVEMDCDVCSLFHDASRGWESSAKLFAFRLSSDEKLISMP